MKDILIHIVAGVVAIVIVTGPLSGYAQQTPASSQPADQAVYTAEQLDQLLAPVALYPDVLLGQLLMASTYPLEVVEAARWVRDPHNAALKDNELTAALDKEDWAPSVKSLIPFPQILEMMDTYLDWTQKLGDAFLAQQADVMNAVQRLRHRAMDAGTLTSGAEQVVVPHGQVIVIEPANPDVIYVPVYNPAIIYGVWPFPAYPPYYFPPPPGYIVEPTLITGFYFTAGIITVNWLWGWDHFDWPHQRIHIDIHRFNVINARHPPVTHSIWVHNHYHRRGVPYPSPGVRSRFERVRPGQPETHRDFRGFEHGAPIVPPATAPRVGPRTAPPRPGEPRPPPHLRVPPRAPPPALSPRPWPPAFQGYSNGTEVRRDAERGRESRRTMPTGRFAPPRDGRAPRSDGNGHGHPGGRTFGGERRD